MITRPLFFVVGVGLGVAAGVWTMRRIDAASRALAPDQVAGRANARATEARTRMSDAVTAGRAAAAAKEAELWAVYRSRSAPQP